MSDRYWRVNASSAYGCRDCGVHVSHVDLHDAFHRRFERLEQHLSPTMTLGESHRLVTASADTGGDDGERRQVEPFVYPGERMIGSIIQHDGGFGFVVVDRDGDEVSSSNGPLPGVIDMMTGALEHYYGSGNPDTPPSAENPDTSLVCAVCGEPVHRQSGTSWRCDNCRMWRDAVLAATQTPPQRAETHQPDTEPPVGSVVRCEGCGNVYVHKSHGWVDTDNRAKDLAWDELQRPSCGPLRVIYTGGAR